MLKFAPDNYAEHFAVCFCFPIILIAKSVSPFLQLNSIIIPYLILSACVAFWNSKPQLQNTCTTNCIICRDILVHSLATCYLEFQTARSVRVSCSWIKYSAIYTGNSSYYASNMLYAFQSLLCLKLCHHNWHKLTTGLSCLQFATTIYNKA